MSIVWYTELGTFRKLKVITHLLGGIVIVRVGHIVGHKVGPAKEACFPGQVDLFVTLGTTFTIYGGIRPHVSKKQVLCLRI